LDTYLRKKEMRHGSLFSGIGGFDLAAQWMGWENVFHCEWNEFGQKVLKYYWPKAISYYDITKTDFTIHRGQIDILTGGFPCQPYSAAGKRLGKEDERHLWPEMLRAIREIQPTWVVGENVLGLVNWNGGLVFDEVQTDLEAEGYEVQPYVLPAVSVNAPHRRDRVWFVAYSDEGKRRTRATISNGEEENKTKRSNIFIDSSGHGLQRTSSDTSSNGLYDESTERHNSIRQDNQQSRTQRERTAEGFGNEWSSSNTDSNRSTQFGENSEDKRQAGHIEKSDEWGQHSEQHNEFSRFQWNATDTDSNGFTEKRRYDSSCKNDVWSNSQSERTTDTKNVNGCDLHRISQEQSSISSNLSGKANVEKNKFAKPTRFCQMDSTNNAERIVNEKQYFIIESGTLVSERQSGFFSSINRGLECNKNLFNGMGEMGSSNDTPRIKSMDGFTSDTDSNRNPEEARTDSGIERKESAIDEQGFRGQQQTSWDIGHDGVLRDAPDTTSKGSRQQPSEDTGWEDRRSDNNGEIQYAPDTDGIRLRRESDRTGESGFLSQKSEVGNWEDFPTVSPIYIRDDGFQSQLDLTAISEAKWRNESIKASGNAIVPQVVFQIFKAIEKYNDSIPNQ
jgi:DNA (cytosine-5)-methyltransferase 1